ncbi:MAG: aspartate 1-decarboxylase [Clostridiales bacterium]|jgi:aspartate 1-decarboxylase|nr:aspartate 1-decarboxylase [Eubacteriales bacterium]MDH7565401.1 aspartate 1-decarboxylase [Clostridiales bacterium]
MKGLFMLKSKIHRATVTDANLNYVGSITIDENLMNAAGLYENEQVQVVNINNGKRFQTYVIKGEKGRGDICLNGAAARLVHKGDLLIIMAYCLIDEESAANHKPVVLHVDEANRIVE